MKMSRTFIFTILCFYFCFYFYFLHSVNLEFLPPIFSKIVVLNCKIIVSLSILFQSIQHLSSMIKDFHLLKFQIPSKTQWFERNISILITLRTVEWFLSHSLIVFFGISWEQKVSSALPRQADLQHVCVTLKLNITEGHEKNQWNFNVNFQYC